MGHFFIPTKSVDDWRLLLADPEKHWRDGYSAKSVAESWQPAGGFPESVKSVLSSSSDPSIADLEFVSGFPELQVPLPGGRRPSQTDVMVIARSSSGLTAIAVEAKAEESFGQLVANWRKSDSEGKAERLAFLLSTLNLTDTDVDGIRYQLLHRTASALLTASAYCAKSAMMLVHSFSEANTGFADYSRFLSLFGIEAKLGEVHSAGTVGGQTLSFGWVADPQTTQA